MGIGTFAQWAPPIVCRPYAMAEFRAMGSPCRIVAEDPELVSAGVALVHRLESLWSRFVATSEVSLLNRSNGSLCLVSPETFDLVERAERARAATGGRFNPLVLDTLESLGYPSGGHFVDSGGVTPACVEPIELFESVNGVRLPAESGFDPGGIGKGLAGDLVVAHLEGLGATTAQVELGGDVRLLGENWVGGKWSVAVCDCGDRRTVLATISVDDGAVATSSILGRQWVRDGRTMHHIIDPITGQPSHSDLVTVTVISAELWWAEVVAKVALLDGSQGARQLLQDHGSSGVLVNHLGDVEAVSRRAGWKVS